MQHVFRWWRLQAVSDWLVVSLFSIYRICLFLSSGFIVLKPNAQNNILLLEYTVCELILPSPECLQDWVIMLLLKHWCMDTVEKIWICDELPNCPTVSAVLLCLTFTTGTRSGIKPAVFFLPPYFCTFLLAKNRQVQNDPWGQCRESLHIYCRVGAIIQWKSVSWHLQAPRVMPVFWLDVSVGCCWRLLPVCASVLVFEIFFLYGKIPKFFVNSPRKRIQWFKGGAKSWMHHECSLTHNCQTKDWTGREKFSAEVTHALADLTHWPDLKWLAWRECILSHSCIGRLADLWDA